METPINYLSFKPKLVECLRDYSRQKLLRDVLAGLTVGIVALPLAIGFGIASGVSPGAGIYTAIIGGFLVSALGGSRVQIGGPAGRSSVWFTRSSRNTGCRICSCARCWRARCCSLSARRGSAR